MLPRATTSPLVVSIEKRLTPPDETITLPLETEKTTPLTVSVPVPVLIASFG